MIDKINEKYLNWILLNPKWLPSGISKKAINNIKDTILVDKNIIADLKKIYVDDFKLEPEVLLQNNKERFYYFVRTFSSDIKWKLKYEYFSEILNKENKVIFK